jgi:hypothetical protein
VPTPKTSLLRLAQEFVSYLRNAVKTDPVVMLGAVTATVWIIMASAKWPGLVMLGGFVFWYYFGKVILAELRRMAEAAERSAKAQERTAAAMEKWAGTARRSRKPLSLKSE